MSCTGRQSVNPNGCCKSGIVRTRCNPNNYWSCPAAGEGEGDVITHVASITLVKVACCVGPCRHDIKRVVRPVTHCLSPCLVSWRSFSDGGLVEEGHKLDYFRVNVIFTCVKMLSSLGPLKQGCPILSGGPCPAECSYNLSQHTCLEVSSNPGDLDCLSSVVFNWG